jgi:predicted dehydrogenase
VINWLVVGAGSAGRCHMAAIEKTPDAALAGVVDPVLPKNDGILSFADLKSALQTLSVDAVVVATPNDVQTSIALEAVSAGLPILCEKPVGLKVTEARTLMALGQRKGVPVGVVLNQRAHRHSRWIKCLIDSGDLEPAKISFSGNVARLTGWHTDPVRTGGGVLRTIGLHYIDLLMWWLGPLSNTSFQMSGAPQENTIMLTADIGAACRAEINIRAVEETSEGPVQCVIESDSAHIRMTGHAIVDAQGVPPHPKPEPLDADLFYGPGHLTVIAEATEAMRKGESFPVPLSEVLPALDCIEELYEARRTS